MLGWLAEWLRGIIAVVLLASFIDLLLPNRSMQRYVRLVASLIILLTILSPIISLLKGDFNERLDERFANWLDTKSSKTVHMPTLQEIQRDAEGLRRQGQAAAAALTERKLAEAMLLQIRRQTGAEATDVAVELGLQSGSSSGSGGNAYIAKVTVTLAARENFADDSEDASSEQAEDIAEVEPVAVSVQLDETGKTGEEETEQASSDWAGRFIKVEGEAADAIRQTLLDGWLVAPESVMIREEKR